MCCVEVLKKLPYLLILFCINSALCAENNPVITNHTASKEVSLENAENSTNSGFFLPLKSTTIVVDSNISESNVNSSSQKSDNSFTPSIHLGTIEDSHDYETRNPKAHPFNNVQHFEYGNPAVGDVTGVDGDVGIVSVTDPQSVKEHVQYVYDVDERDRPHPSAVIHHASHHSYPHQPYAESYLTIDVPSTSPVYYGNPDHQHHFHHHFNNHQHHQHQHDVAEPIVDHITLEKPSKYENLNPPSHYHHYEYAVPHNNEPLKQPEMNIPLHPYQYYYHNHHPHVGSHNIDIIKPVKEPESSEPLKKPEITVPPVHPYHQHYYHNNNNNNDNNNNNHHQPLKAHAGIIDKPETVLYLTSHRETSFTRTRKFPYKYYQPQDDTEIHLVKDEHAFPPRRRQISPWHKIIHIIGAFLPLGLLIAALKPPNVIKIDSNNTDPNIVLSKLRGIQMPIEHKQIDNDNEEELCRDRSICQSILNGAGRNENLIHNALGNFAIRQSMKQNEVRKSKFHEIFEAVRKKDCNIINC